MRDTLSAEFNAVVCIGPGIALGGKNIDLLFAMAFPKSTSKVIEMARISPKTVTRMKEALVTNTAKKKRCKG